MKFFIMKADGKTIEKEIDIEIGDGVVVPDPEDTDDWSHSFSGMVTGFRNGNVQVTDGDGDVFECEPERLELEA